MRGEKDTWARVGLEHRREEETFWNREEDETLFYISIALFLGFSSHNDSFLSESLEEDFDAFTMAFSISGK
ncbi:hypothetical protein MRB53_032218 [Persea americana]|uniref:Uncharacterized protein n=1 Tax=Persea americana TaxID=3435 RepID=A0ACC2KRI5_PERAE|nr:hypothetical protein MRB53_032218 [Persea americana]